MRPGPRRKVQFRTETRASPTTVRVAGSPPAEAWAWRRVTTARRLTTPIITTAPSMRREVTKPRAIDLLRRRSTGKRATADPTAVRALTTSSTHPQITRVSCPPPVMYAASCSTGARSSRAGIEEAKVSR